MKIVDGIKFGFGLAIGIGLADALSKCGLRYFAQNEKYMEDLKERDPKRYESLKKYA